MKNCSYQLKRSFNQGDDSAIEIYRGQLIQCGISEESIIELSTGGSVELSFYGGSNSQVQAIKSRLQLLGNAKKSSSIVKVEEKDWVNVWKDSFRPFNLTKTIKVVPAWERAQYTKEKEKIIFIDTQLAFGTGLHETTRFTSGLIERCAGKFETFFDIGTGTGILMMVAMLNGAKDVFGLDIDASAIEMAKENLRNNHYSDYPVQAIDIKGFKSRKKYDFVAANLVTHDLLRLKNKIFSYVKTGKYLAISGISLDNLKRIKESFNQLPLRCLKIEKGKKWAALLYKKTD